MTIPTFSVPPEKSSYSVADGTSVISTKLDGGVSRYRRDILNSSSIVNVVWNFTYIQYLYFKYFTKTSINNEADPFKINLVLDSPEPTEHEVHFVPGSIKLTGQSGQAYFVAAQLETLPVALTETEVAMATAYATYGELWTEHYP